MLPNKPKREDFDRDELGMFQFWTALSDWHEARAERAIEALKLAGKYID